MAQEAVIAWEYTAPMPSTALSSSAGATLHWHTPVCPAGILVEGPAQERFATDPLTMQAQGETKFAVSGLMEAEGEVDHTCTFKAYVVSDGTEARTGDAETALKVEVGYLGRIKAYAPVTHLVGGPQKQVVFTVFVENLGNSRTIVEFDVTRGEGNWRAIAPPSVLVDLQGHSNVSVDFVVSTPYQNGPNSGEQEFTMTVRPHSLRDDGLHGEAVQITFTAGVEGMYIPGADAWLPAALLGAALLAAYRKRP